MGSYQEIEGDLIALARSGHFDMIIHGCNCQCNMGSGIARTIAQRWPQALSADLLTTPGDAGKLGTFTQAIVPIGVQDELVIINAYTQDRYGRTNQPWGQVHFVPQALERVLQAIEQRYPAGTRIGMPLIGAGRAGGDWAQIQAAIKRCLPTKEVTIVRWDQTDHQLERWREQAR